MGSWVRTITTPFRKARTLINPPRDHKKPQVAEHEHQKMTLHCEVMACPYEDVQVMWSILDHKSKAGEQHQYVSTRSTLSDEI